MRPLALNLNLLTAVLVALAIRVPVSAPAADAQPADQPAPAEAATKSDELLAQAIGAVKESDLPKAALKLEQLLKADPNNRNALVLFTKIRQQQGVEQVRPDSSAYFRQAANLARRVIALPKELDRHEKNLFAAVFYYEATTSALDKQPRKAVASLRDAYQLGFADVDSLDTDEDLATLRSVPEFQRLRGQIEERAIPIAREHAAELLAANKPFPFEFELTDLNGKTVALADLRGKVAIVDVWGTWCPPCRMEVPHFVKLYERYHGKGLEIVGVNYEREDDDKKARQVIRDFVKRNHVPYPCVLGDEKTQKAIPDFQGFPTTLFIGRDGTVRLKAVGYHGLIDLDAIVSQLLNETPAKAR